ncbi:MAG TPA: PadR family transcriptional regulator [Solirubrobacteraceae bacterium]|nr:PadR family transcriptional regulator [Solirubrobacteraceae bacterium]
MTGSSYAAGEGSFRPHPRGKRSGLRAAWMRGAGPYGRRGDFGFGGPFGPRGFGGPRGHGGKARRGDIRTAALLLLAEEPRNGYAIMQEIEQRSGGVWSPSPGSIYPALSQLEDEGLIRSEENDGRKVFAITDAGRDALAARAADAPAPWDTLMGGVSNDVRELFGVMRQLGVAGLQLAQTASESQLAEAKKVLSEARRSLYKILADGEDQA